MSHCPKEGRLLSLHLRKEMDTLSKIKVLHGTTDLNKEPLTSVETFHGTKGSLQLL